METEELNNTNNIAATAPYVSSNSSHNTGAVMTEEAQKERRNSIRDILSDDSLTPLEKRRSIQSLMDGRRRSSNATHSSDDNDGMARAAAEAAEFYCSDTDDDPMDTTYNYNQQQQQYYGDGAMDTSTGPNNSSSAQSNNNNNNGNNRQPFRRKERSTSLPGWSESGMMTTQAVAPTMAAAGGYNSTSIWDDPINVSRRMEKSRPACSHYERNCTIISPCCGLAFGCRICHDECPVLPMPFSKRQSESSQQVARIHAETGVRQKQEKRRSLPLGWEDEETHHEIDRFAIREIICRLCYVRQSSKTNYCITCQAQFGAYHCNICNLWMSDEESPYHCSDCGFCRVGGRENFRHCDDCGMCIDTLLFDDHNCKAGKYMSNCPVCQEDLFSSRDASHEMPCGHAIHWHCFKELTSYDTRCPVCKKTAETPEHMAPTWQAMAMGIALQPVPPELARVVTIMCNDCELRDVDRRWHFLGVRCMNCMSFNTTVERTTMTGRDAAAYLDELDAIRGGADGQHANGSSEPRPMDAS